MGFEGPPKQESQEDLIRKKFESDLRQVINDAPNITNEEREKMLGIVTSNEFKPDAMAAMFVAQYAEYDRSGHPYQLTGEDLISELRLEPKKE